jgi:hypothetical protein
MNKNQNGYYITRDNPSEKVLLEPQEKINLSFIDLIELVLPMCKSVWCNSNYLKELIVPESVELLNCSNNQLTELIISKSCKLIECSNNKLNKLIIYGSPSLLWCTKNDLHPIIIDLFQSNDPVKIQLANSLQNNLQK